MFFISVCFEDMKTLNYEIGFNKRTFFHGLYTF